ncbi:hypothetical protein CDL15_Pgr023951 [Punica granatum]|uniref:Uncharacterized protein n=1 Tax=Punica granatum TaxID=22663 RepID=A0A218WV77_PUNGR|nr:hypothetical protein CDL15_Pgr023951 [Punica granatum]PKI39325.1 hypothetical protein CRG98_040282 [Punica granatum]
MAFTWPRTATTGGCWTAIEAEKVAIIADVLFATFRDWARLFATGRHCSRLFTIVRDGTRLFATRRDCSLLDATVMRETGHGCPEPTLVA